MIHGTSWIEYGPSLAPSSSIVAAHARNVFTFAIDVELPRLRAHDEAERQVALLAFRADLHALELRRRFVDQDVIRGREESRGRAPESPGRRVQLAALDREIE